MRVVVDQGKCIKNKACVVIARAVLEFAKDDVLRVLQEQPPESLRERVERAAKQCPTQAITIHED